MKQRLKINAAGPGISSSSLLKLAIYISHDAAHPPTHSVRDSVHTKIAYSPKWNK